MSRAPQVSREAFRDGLNAAAASPVRAKSPTCPCARCPPRLNKQFSAPEPSGGPERCRGEVRIAKKYVTIWNAAGEKIVSKKMSAKLGTGTYTVRPS